MASAPFLCAILPNEAAVPGYGHGRLRQPVVFPPKGFLGGAYGWVPLVVSMPRRSRDGRCSLALHTETSGETPGEECVIDDVDDAPTPKKRLYASISAALKTTSRKADKLRDQRARRRPNLTLRSWNCIRHRSNPLREEKVRQLVTGQSVLPVVGHCHVLEKTGMSKEISLRDLKTCEPGNKVGVGVIDWLLGHFNAMPQLDDQFFYPTKFAISLRESMAGRSGWIHPKKRSFFLEWHWRVVGQDGRRRKLMEFGKVFIPFRGDSGLWCLAYAQPAVDRKIRLYGTEGPNDDNVPDIVQGLKTILEEQEFSENLSPKAMGARKNQRYDKAVKGVC